MEHKLVATLLNNYIEAFQQFAGPRYDDIISGRISSILHPIIFNIPSNLDRWSEERGIDREDRDASPRFIGHRIFQIRVTVKRDTREVASSSSDRSDVGSSEVTFHSPNPLTSEKELPPDRVPLPFSLEKWNGFVPGYFSGRERKDKRET